MREPRASRILQAAVTVVRRDGAASLSMQHVADVAHVSKGLIHYHFHDKDSLVARLVAELTRECGERERDALSRSTPATATEDLWQWLSAEVARGDLRVLLELSEERGRIVEDAVRESTRARRESAMHSVARLFAVLELAPRVPAGLLGGVVLAFQDGLVMHAAREPERNHRVAFDVFWLSLLSLAE